MVNASTTHVLEIETGIGEPAVVPLTSGQELEPLSVGTQGMWRVESAGVLTIHAFFYFDGTALYVQSAEERSPAYVDGQAVAASWTQLHAPCKISVGSATLRFRSVAAAGDDDDAATAAMDRPPVSPSVSELETERLPAPRPAAGAPPDQLAQAPAAHERPFGPGELVPLVEEDESTRVAPLEGAGSRPQPGPPPSAPSSGALFGMNAPPVQPLAPAPHLSGAHLSPMAMGGGMHPNAPPAAPMMPMHAGMSGAFPNALPGGGYGGEGFGGAGGYLSVRDEPTNGAPTLIDKFKELPPLKRVLLCLSPFLLLASYLLLLEDDPPATAAAPASAQQPSGPARPVCPPGFVCVPEGDVPPCAPAGATAASAPPAKPAAVAAPAIAGDDDDAEPSAAPSKARLAKAAAGASAETDLDEQQPADKPLAPGAKTLERQAVDALAVNDYALAADLYEELDRVTPNRTYAEAVRILRAKAEAAGP